MLRKLSLQSHLRQRHGHARGLHRLGPGTAYATRHRLQHRHRRRRGQVRRHRQRLDPQRRHHDNTINTFDVHRFLGVDVSTALSRAPTSQALDRFGSQRWAPTGHQTRPGHQAGAVTTTKCSNTLMRSRHPTRSPATDINESTLNMPPEPNDGNLRRTGTVNSRVDGTFAKVTSKVLPAGSYAIAATGNMHSAEVLHLRYRV